MLPDVLPATGFSTAHPTEKILRPLGLSYGSTGLTLQIPELDVQSPIVTVPMEDGSYPVEWLESSVGLLERSSLPGEGITILTGHNHLNSTETEPFLFLHTLQEGDRIMITNDESEMLTYQVYGNYKIAANDFMSIAGDLRDNALVLITCEDENIDGGYLNRRVIFAEQ
jgi:LPXTG-site transpeptidase (sortase) family protein